VFITLSETHRLCFVWNTQVVQLTTKRWLTNLTTFTVYHLLLRLWWCTALTSIFKKKIFNLSDMSRLTDIIPNLNRKTKQLPCAVKWLGQDHLHPLLEQLRQTCHGWRLWNEPGPPLWEATTLAKSYLFETCLRYIVIASFYIFYHYLICRSSNFLSNGSSLILLCRKTDFKGGGAWSNESEFCCFRHSLWLFGSIY
jgi:hypothetical protein